MRTYVVAAVAGLLTALAPLAAEATQITVTARLNVYAFAGPNCAGTHTLIVQLSDFVIAEQGTGGGTNGDYSMRIVGRCGAELTAALAPVAANALYKPRIFISEQHGVRTFEMSMYHNVVYVPNFQWSSWVLSIRNVTEPATGGTFFETTHFGEGGVLQFTRYDYASANYVGGAGLLSASVDGLTMVVR